LTIFTFAPSICSYEEEAKEEMKQQEQEKEQQ
jgi:hypothetical protein